MGILRTIGNFFNPVMETPQPIQEQENINSGVKPPNTQELAGVDFANPPEGYVQVEAGQNRNSRHGRETSFEPKIPNGARPVMPKRKGIDSRSIVNQSASGFEYNTAGTSNQN